MAGVTNEGFVAKSLEQITNDINTSMISKFGQNFDVSPESPDGQIIGVFAKMIYETWQQMEAAYDAYCPSNAFGLGLDKLCELNGVVRIKNQPTTVAITFSGTAGTIIPQGYVVKTDDDLEFATIVEAVIPTVVTAECKTEGAIYIAANEVNVLTDAIAGLSSATNLEPGITGIVAEEDPALRNRRETLVINSGTSSIEAIYSAVRSLNLPYITILENYSSTIVDGIPPHSFITVVEGGTPEEISRIIFDNKPLGVQAFGDIVTQVYDYKGFPHSIGISRPIPIDVDIICNVTKLQGASLDTQTLCQDALVAHINGLNISDDVYWAQLFNIVLSSAPQISVTSITIKKSTDSVYGTTDLDITSMQRARTSSSRVVVNVI